MRKIFAVSLVLLVIFTGCIRKAPRASVPGPSQPEPQPEASAREPAKPAGPESPKPESEEASTVQEENDTPESAVERILKSVNELGQDKTDELVKQYFSEQEIPDEYLCLIKPVSERITCKTGESRITGNKAEIDITVTVVDVQLAVAGVMPTAVAHLAAMQLSGKDVSNPEKILAEYAAKNIDWDTVPTVKSTSTLYLVMGADGEWKIDVTNPDNLNFVNNLSGGAYEVVKKLKSFADRYK